MNAPATQALHLSKSAEWQTPDHVVLAATLVMNGIDLDPASNERANESIGARKIYTIETNGLLHPWHGRVFLNPPGDRSGQLVKAFWTKLVEEYLAGNVTEAIYLGFSLEQLVSLQNKQIQASPLDCPICVPRTRLAFIDEFSEVRNAPTHGNFLAYLGPNVEVFTEVFEDLVGAVR